MQSFLFYAALLTALGMVRFHAKPDDDAGTPGLGPEKGPTTPDAVEAQRRRHALQVQNTLRDKYSKEAADEAQRTGRPVTPKDVPSIEEILAGHTEDPSTMAGPTPGLQPLRPGESASGPATGPLATGRLVPEHQALTTQPTVNAPGLGADSGAKKTADNPDARAGQFGHAGGVDPADPAFQTGTAETRTDTVGEQAKRRAAEDELNAAVNRGEAPTREQLIAAGCPESELDRALAAGAEEAKARKEFLDQEAARAGTGGSTGEGATGTGDTATDTAKKAPETAEELVNLNTREQLVTLADAEGVEVHSGDTKATIAEAIVAKRTAGK